MQPEPAPKRFIAAEESAFGAFSPQQQLAHLQALLHCSHDAIFSYDINGVVLSWNPAAERVYGYASSEIIGSDVSKILPSDRKGEIPNTVASIVSGSTPEPFETKRIRKDGTVIDVYITISPVRSSSGQLLGISTIARDITPRKRAEAALAQKQAELEDFFENAVIGLHWVGADGTIIWANKAEMDLLGYSRDEYIGHKISEFHADSETINDILCRLTRNEKLQGYEARLLCKDGSIKHVLISSSVLWDNDTFVHTRCFTVDITEKKLAEEALQRAEKLAAAGQLAAGMAHEINNPLEAVMNLLYIVQTNLTDETLRGFLTRAEGELKRVAYISRRTLAFFKEGPDRRDLDLDELVGDVISVYQSKIQGRQIKIEARLSPARTNGFEGELRQVIANLLLNAIEASQLKGRILVRVRQTGATVACTISDQGSGISPEHRRKVFQPFFTTKKDTGTGLGLWVSKEIVRKHGGRIQFRSSATHGTVFRVEFPSAEQTDGSKFARSA